MAKFKGRPTVSRIDFQLDIKLILKADAIKEIYNYTKRTGQEPVLTSVNI